jgi:hypothetical protein
MRVIAYTYDADYHCIDCTKDYLGTKPKANWAKFHEGEEEVEDSEGNPLHPVFDTDEWYANDIYEGRKHATLSCGTCGDIIREIDLT